MVGQSPLISGLYVITEARLMPEPVFLARAEAALRGGGAYSAISGQGRCCGRGTATAAAGRGFAGALRAVQRPFRRQ